MEVKIHDFGEQLLESGTVGHKVELLSSRGDILIPLKYESEGIIKIISFLNILCQFIILIRKRTITYFGNFDSSV